VTSSLAPVVLGRERIFCCHRGRLARRWPDNSLAGIRACVSAGVPRLEIDVRFLGDGALLVFHDDRLERETDGSGAPEELDSAAIARVRYRADGAPLAMLGEVVELLRGSRTVLQVDLKGQTPITGPCAATLARALASLQPHVLVGSQAHWNLRPLARLGLPVALDPTLQWHALRWRRAGDGYDPSRLGRHGLWDDAPLAHRAGVAASAYLEARIADLLGLLPAVEWMVDIDTVLHIASLGLPLGHALGEHGVQLAAWTLGDEGADASAALLRRLFEVGVTTVIADDAQSLAGYAAAL
jgi:glycerophosphoryl diester phosphodiesterase